jgi:phosphoglycolate phosphatase
MSRRFDLLVLDLDGTLVDSQALLVGLVNAVLQDAGHAAAPPAVVATSIGLPLDEVFRRAVPGIRDAAIDSLCATYRGRADHHDFVRQFRLYPDVTPTLAALRDAGLRLVIGTSKGRATTTDIARHCGIADWIDEVIGGDSVTRGKPHPEMVRRAQALFGTPSERTLMVGDTSFDITMGQAAGVATCAVTYGMHATAVLRALQPNFLIGSFSGLLDLVHGPQPAVGERR